MARKDLLGWQRLADYRFYAFENANLGPMAMLRFAVLTNMGISTQPLAAFCPSLPGNEQTRNDAGVDLRFAQAAMGHVR